MTETPSGAVRPERSSARSLYRQFFGDSSYSFEHRGVHFVALDNDSRPKPELNAERIAWLRNDPLFEGLTAAASGAFHRPMRRRARAPRPRRRAAGTHDYWLSSFCITGS